MTAPRAMTGRVTLGNGEVRNLASPGKRLAARIIDGALVLVAAVFLSAVIRGSDSFFLRFFLFMVVVFFLLLLYEPTLIALRGQTLGKAMMNVKVVGAEDGEIPGWGKSLGRWLLPGLLSLIPILGGLLSLLVYVSLLWDDRRQGWHDKTAATVVIDV